jgi:hypothetical protein
MENGDRIAVTVGKTVHTHIAGLVTANSVWYWAEDGRYTRANRCDVAEVQLICTRGVAPKLHMDSGARKGAHTSEAIVLVCGAVVGATFVQYGHTPRDFTKDVPWCALCAPIYHGVQRKDNLFL